jgi:hypothetical protein
MAAKGQEPARERDKLMLQLQPWPGERMARECLRVPGQPQDAVSYGYLGDMQLRLVFDEPGLTRPVPVQPADIARLGLTPQKAVAHAAANCKRVNGVPQIAPLDAGVYALRGPHAMYNAAFLLDRPFWKWQLEKFPQGLLAAVPREGAVVFAPAGSATVENELRRQAGQMYAAAGTARISACVYRFDAQGWHPRGGDLPKELPRALRSKDDDDDEDSDRPPLRRDTAVEIDLDKVAAGQRMLVLSLVGGFVGNAMGRAGVHPGITLAAFLALGVYSLLGVVRLGSGLGRSTPWKIVYMVLSCVPLVSLALWILLSVQATRVLRAAGWHVGLFGARA